MTIQVQATRGRRALRKQRTRESILKAAQDVLLRRGYDRASVEEIAANADVAVGSIYTYFGSKEGLFRAFLDEALREDEAAMDRAHDVNADQSSRLAAMTSELLELHRRNPAMSMLALAPTCGGTPTELTDRVVERTRAEIDRLRSAIADGVRAETLRDVDPDLAAAFLWAAWSGLTALHLRSDALGLSDEDFERTAEVGFRILATGLLRQRPKGATPAADRNRKRTRPRHR